MSNLRNVRADYFVDSKLSANINYITNSNAQTNSKRGWNTFADAAATTPADGTGGTANSTWTVTSSSPIRGSYAFLWTKNSGASRQGEGASFNFTIDSADKGKVLQGSFDYAVISGTFVDDAMSIWIYDVTNATMIQPAPYLLKNHSLASERFGFEFQTSSSSTSYRLIIYVPVSTNSANTLQFSNFTLGPQAKLYGSPVTDWVSFTPTGGWSSNTTYTGAWKRVGDMLHCKVLVTVSAAPTSAALSINLPSGLTIDTTKLSTGTDNRAIVGYGLVRDVSPGASYQIAVGYLGTNTSVTALVIQTDSTYGSLPAVTQAIPMTFANTDSVEVTFTVPISGWSSSVVMSSDANTRVVAAIMRKNTSQTGVNTNNSSVKVTLDTAAYDTHGGVNTGSNRYDVKVAGYYRVSARATLQSTNVIANADAYLVIYKNGSEAARGISSFGPVSTGRELGVTNLLYLAVGDYLELYFYGAGNNSGSNLTLYGDSSSANYTSLHVEMVSGPAQIAASETVAWNGYTTSTQTMTSSFVQVTSWTTTSDTHGAFSTGSSNYTVPVSGRYRISGNLVFAAHSSVNLIKAAVYKNGAILGQGNQLATALTYASASGFSNTYRLLAGDVLTFYGYAVASVALAPPDTSAQHWSIDRVGNY